MHYHRLKKNNQFQKLFKKGKRVFSPYVTLLYVKGGEMTMGIALTKKHGKAVKRNRIKRLVRAAFDKNCCMLASSYSIVVLPKVMDEYDYKNIEKSLISCFKKINQCEK